jgi:hypothetical protein
MEEPIGPFGLWIHNDWTISASGAHLEIEPPDAWDLRHLGRSEEVAPRKVPVIGFVTDDEHCQGWLQRQSRTVLLVARHSRFPRPSGLPPG